MENANVKRRPKGLIIGLAAIAAVIIISVVILCILQPWASSVATVDNLKVTSYEYKFFSKFNMDQFLSSMSNDATADKYDWSTKKGSETAKDSVKKSTFEQIQEFKIQIIKAKEAGLKLDDEDLDKVDAAINTMITQNNSRNAAEEFCKSNYGVTLSEYKEIYKSFTLAQKYQAYVIKDVNVTDDEIQKYYDENKSEFDKVTVTHILIKTIDDNGASVSEGKKSELRKKADELLARVKAGEDIKKLALEYSEDKPAVTNKDGRGYQGEYTFVKGEMTTEFEKWAFDESRKEGDADVVETLYGYHVMQFHKRTVTPLDDVKDSIKAVLLAQKQSEYITKKLEELKKDSRYTLKIDEKAIAKLDKSLFGF